jgi:hypothetical protein
LNRYDDTMSTKAHTRRQKHFILIISKKNKNEISLQNVNVSSDEQEGLGRVKDICESFFHMFCYKTQYLEKRICTIIRRRSCESFCE